MVPKKRALIVGGTSGVGLALAQLLAERGEQVLVCGRHEPRAQVIADSLGEGHLGLGFDLSEPEAIKEALADVGSLDRVALIAVERDRNTIGAYDVAAAQRALAVKLIGYATVVAAVKSHLQPGAALVLFGGIGLVRPYPGSTSVSTVNGGVVGLARTLTVELSPVRVNVIHPGLVEGTQSHADAPAALAAGVLARTPERRLVTTGDVARAAAFLFDSAGVNGVELIVDGGFHVQ